MFSDILPLRAVLFQLLFLLVAIALEALVFYRTLNLDYKTSAQYSATVNLLSTFLGWFVFFTIQPFLPEGLRVQLISYIFFEQFFPNPWLTTIPSILVILGLGIFLATFLVKLKGLDILEALLEKNKDKKQEESETRTGRLRRLRNQSFGFRPNSKPYSVLIANIFSFGAISFLLFVRLVEQTYYTPQ